jgi:hypothetical protein
MKQSTLADNRRVSEMAERRLASPANPEAPYKAGPHQGRGSHFVCENNREVFPVIDQAFVSVHGAYRNP